MSWVILNLTYLLLCAQYLVRDMLLLRGLAISASVCSIITMMHREIYNIVVWNLFFLAINVVQLTLLILHVWLFREATRPIGVWQALEVGPATAVLFGFVVIAAVASWQWQRVDYRYGAEWLLRKLAP